jgi:hypothetical protein
MWRLFTTDRHMRSQDRDIRGDKVVSRTADTTNAREGENEMNKECNCDNLDQDISGYTCYKCYEKGN